MAEEDNIVEEKWQRNGKMVAVEGKLLS